MKLYLVTNGNETLFAEINGNSVKIHNATVDRMIQDSVTLPAMKEYEKIFGSYTVHKGHELWGKAVAIFLNDTVISKHPERFRWAGVASGS